DSGKAKKEARYQPSGTLACCRPEFGRLLNLSTGVFPDEPPHPSKAVHGLSPARSSDEVNGRPKERSLALFSSREETTGSLGTFACEIVGWGRGTCCGCVLYRTMLQQ